MCSILEEVEPRDIRDFLDGDGKKSETIKGWINPAVLAELLEQKLCNLQRQQCCSEPGLIPARDYNIDCKKLEKISLFSNSRAPGDLWLRSDSNIP